MIGRVLGVAFQQKFRVLNRAVFCFGGEGGKGLPLPQFSAVFEKAGVWKCFLIPGLDSKVSIHTSSSKALASLGHISTCLLIYYQQTQGRLSMSIDLRVSLVSSPSSTLAVSSSLILAIRRE